MRILLIEDSPRLQESLTAGFEKAGFAIDAVGDGERGLRFARRTHYDVVIQDLMLPKLGGFEVLKSLRDDNSMVHILVLTAMTSVQDRVSALEQGADDYLPKPFYFEELIARVQALIRRAYGTKTPCLAIGGLRIDTSGQRVTYCETVVPVTRREFLILRYMAMRQKEVVSRIDIEDHIYGERDFPESNTVQSAICTLRKKLDAVAGRPLNIIRTARGLGYSLTIND